MLRTSEYVSDHSVKEVSGRVSMLSRIQSLTFMVPSD